MNATDQIDHYVTELDDWRGERIGRYRAIIHEAYPDIQEEWKWDVPVFVGNKMIMAMSAFKEHIKINFFNGAQLDGLGLFNSGLDSKSHRSINLAEHDMVNEVDLRALIVSAIALDSQKKK